MSVRRIFDFGFWILDSGRRVANPKSKIQNPKFLVLVIGGLVVGFLTVHAAAIACPLCKEAIFDPAQLHQRLSTAKAYALSIGLMLTMPAALVGAVAAGLIRGQRRAKRMAAHREIGSVED